MTWFKVDDGFPAHRKVEALQGMPPATYTAAITIWTLMGADCGLNLSDGVFSRVRLRKITGLPDKLLDVGLAALVKVGLFDRAGDECAFHDWASMQPTRAQVEAQRAMKSAAGRSGGLASGESRAKQVLTKNEAGASALAKQNASNPLPDDEARARVRNPDPTRPDQGENPPTPASGGDGGPKPVVEAAKPKRQRAPRVVVEGEPDPLPFTIDAALSAVEAASGGKFAKPIRGEFDPKHTRPLVALIRRIDDLDAFARVGRWIASGKLDWCSTLNVAWLLRSDTFVLARQWEESQDTAPAANDARPGEAAFLAARAAHAAKVAALATQPTLLPRTGTQ